MRLPFGLSQNFAALRLLLATLVVGLLFAACGTSGGGVGGPAPGIDGSGGAVKVALLLPITSSGSTPAIAKALKQAAELALFDFDNPNVLLVPKDTKGSPEGARIAAESAVQEGAELIIGPLFAQEVTGAAQVARQSGIPMIAFSSDEKVAGGGVYLLSFVAGRDVPRIASFAVSRGKRNFALLTPQTAYGRIAETAFSSAVSSGGQIVLRSSFPPNSANGMVGPVKQVAHAIQSGQADTVFIPAGREELPALGPVLASNGVTSDRVQFIGTGQWDYPNIAGERALIGGWYPAPDPKGWSNFVGRYSQTYGVTPPRIASLAYDAVSLAVSLSSNPQGQRYSMGQLTRASGFAGVDGLFRLRSDGTSERGLAILEVGQGGPRVIDPAPSSFATASTY